jgi:hypothetical protein
LQICFSQRIPEEKSHPVRKFVVSLFEKIDRKIILLEVVKITNFLKIFTALQAEKTK